MTLEGASMKFVIYIEQMRQSIYRANCLSLPGCSVLGSSAAEAQQKISEAIVWYLAGLNAPPPESVELQVELDLSGDKR